MTVRERRCSSTEGLTLVEAATAMTVLGVLLAVFIPTFVRQLRTSKTAEATTELARLHRHTASYYAASHRGRRRCLPSPAGPTPADLSATPREIEFAEDPAHGTVWGSLGYEPAVPVRFRYTFVPQRVGCGLRQSHLVTFRAEADLDGDGRHSRFERLAGVKQGEFAPIEILHIDERNE